MLYEFIRLHRDAIIARTRGRVRDRSRPSDPAGELEHGVPLFLTQLSETLRLETTATPFSNAVIGATAARHGAELLAAGFSVSQVVHGYGDICQSITEIAALQAAPISAEEFHTLNRCLDTAIAEAVTEHARLTAERRTSDEVERFGRTAHELRDLLNTALLAFHALQGGTVGVRGNTAAVLGRNLAGLRDLVDRSLSEVRLAAGKHHRQRLAVRSFVDDIAAAALLHSDYRRIQFTAEPVDPALVIHADPQVLSSAVMNLLSNAFKNTPPEGRVNLRAHALGERLVVEVADECGGFPEGKNDLFKPFGERRGTDRSGLGLGLSMARQAVRAHEGDIKIRNLPGKGCVFTIDVPLAPAAGLEERVGPTGPGVDAGAPGSAEAGGHGHPSRRVPPSHRTMTDS